MLETEKEEHVDAKKGSLDLPSLFFSFTDGQRQHTHTHTHTHPHTHTHTEY
jgi:hypothetical protein